jgi:D-psicose/D-tagatose/L-ribulose 3-epimerase
MAFLAIGISTFVWYSPLSDESLSAIAPKVAEWGFDAIELPVESVGDWDPQRTHELLAKSGLKGVVGAVMPAGRELVQASKTAISETQAYLRSCVDAASIIGSPVVTGPVYASVGRTWRQTPDERKSAIEELRRNLKPVVAYAAERHVRLALEPLNRYETSLVNTAEQAYEIVEPLSPDGIGVTLDTYHMNIEERSSADAIRLVGDRLVYFQVCGNDRGAPGKDQIDWPGIGKALAEVGYEGIASIESFTSSNITIATAASIWRPLGHSQDDIARDGLAFLQPWRGEHWGVAVA